MTIDPDWVEEIKSQLPELPIQRSSRFVKEYELSEYDAGLLTISQAMADFFEEAVGGATGAGHLRGKLAKSVSNWALGDLSRLLNLDNLEISESNVTPAHLLEFVNLIEAGDISNSTAKNVLEDVFNSGVSPAEVVKDKGYIQINDSAVLKSAVAQAIKDNPKAVDDYRNGKDTAAKFLVGQVMQITKGQAKPELVNQLVEEALGAVS